MRFYLFLFVLSFSGLSYASDAELGDRLNVMECSHDEVVAYMELPNPERQALSDFSAWTASYKSTEVVRAENDPTVCIGLLYGDMSKLTEQVKLATNSLMSLTMPGMDDILGGLDDLKESICERANTAMSNAENVILQQSKAMKNDANSELVRRYGQSAMDRYITDAVVPPEYKAQGLKYRNGGLSEDQFRKNVRKRWQKDLKELSGL